jgi:iron complex outermembrane recepter protein
VNKTINYKNSDQTDSYSSNHHFTHASIDPMGWVRKGLAAGVGLMVGTGSYSYAETADWAIEEVVITAQKRAQSLQDVGIAVSAFTGDSLRELNSNSVTQIGKQTPNLDINGSENSLVPIITIRGLGLNNFLPNTSSSAGVYVDEVYLTSPAMLNFAFFDLERIEVLKGPQGTLFGKNTTAGAISVVSAKPTDEFNARANVGFSNFDGHRVEAAVSGPFSDTVAGRFAAISRQQNEGYIKNLLDGSDNGAIEKWAARAQLDWQPSDALQVLFNVHGGRDQSDFIYGQFAGLKDPSTAVGPCGAGLGESSPVPGCVNFPVLLVLGGAGAGVANDDGDNFAGEYNYKNIRNDEQLGTIVTVNWDLGDVTLTSLSGYESLDRYAQNDGDGSRLTILHQYRNIEIEQYSQELRLTSNDYAEFNWIAGLYASSDKIVGDPAQFFIATDSVGSHVYTEYTQKTETAAAFVHTEWQFTDTWKLISGLRYTSETKKMDIEIVDLDPFGTSLLVDGFTVLAQVDDKFDDTDLSGKISLEYTPDNDWLFYAGVSKGFKSGGFSAGFTTSSEALRPFDSEVVIAYEGGFKSTLLDGTLQLNGALFVYDYNDIQLQTVDTSGGTPVVLLQNASSADIRGLELEAQWRPISHFDIHLGVGLLETEVEEYPSTNQVFGDELANSPHANFNGMLRYEWPVADSFNVIAMTDFSYTGDSFKEGRNAPIFKQDAYWLYNARLALASPDAAWEVALWGKNLSDEEYLTSVFDLEQYGTAYFRYAMPRTYGIEFSYSWE